MERYHVSASRAVKAQFREVIELARQAGRFAAAVESGDWILGELACTPMEFGESRDYLPTLDIHVRIAFVGPVSVWFGVHQTKRKVFVLKFGWIGE
jgi:hypothetical protein